jgi:predicted transcriptional regulator of viral defense system
MNNTLGVNEKNRKLLDELHRFERSIFFVEEAAKFLKLPVNKTRTSLGYLARRGWLTRIKPGLYTVVPLGIINPQEYRKNVWVIATQIFAPCYIGGWSAAEYWALTDQIFNSVFVCTTKSFRKKETIIQGTQFILKLVSNYGHTKSIWEENTKIQVSDPAQTLTDILDDPNSGGGMRHVAEIVNAFFETNFPKDYNLVTYLTECKNRTAYKRLGYILETLNIDATELIAECQKNISAGYSTFDPGIKTRGTYNRRWNLIINAEIKDDY